MKRLTRKNMYGVYEASADSVTNFNSSTIIGECIDKLAAYEDSGLQPKEVPTADQMQLFCNALGLLQEYEDAKDAGTLFQTTCKLGDTVYFMKKYRGAVIGGVQSGKIQMIGFTTRGVHIKVSGHAEYNKTFLLGKTAFLTPGEAVIAQLKLEQQQRNNK